MNFVQIEFAAFFAAVYAAYWLLGTLRRQNALLLVASAVFYGWVHPWFVVLLYSASIVDFAATNLMVTFPRRRNLFLVLSVGSNLTLLGFFKYFDFFVANVGALLTALGLEVHPAGLGILLPVGISFYTFQTLGYVVDVWRGELRPRNDFLTYLAYVSFFPQLVAGPIERAGRLLPQFERPRTWSSRGLETGITLMLWGAVKKVVIADSIAPYVDKVFALRDPAGPLIWTATAAFMIQIFADFSGYTDIARGTARLLGFELVENFRQPFLATSVSEFWQRWHISLSSWIRDYLLGPLLGPHPGRLRFAAATLVTFLLIGFWHGPSWNFALFGLYHGFWTVVQGVVARPAGRLTRIPGWQVPAIGFQLLGVGLVGSLFFREHSLTRIGQHLSKSPFSASEDEWVVTTVVASVTTLATVPLILGWAWDRWVTPRFAQREAYFPVRTSAWVVYALALWLFWRVTAQDFVYFQF